MTGCIRKFIANEHEYTFAQATVGDVTNGFDVRTYRSVNYVAFQFVFKILPFLQRNVPQIGVAIMHVTMEANVYRRIKERFVCVH